MPSVPKPTGASLKPHADPGSWLEMYPLLAGYMTDPTWPDGKPRKPAKIFIALDRGKWHFTLKEPSVGYVLQAVVETPEEGLHALEGLLTMPEAPWMVDPWEEMRGRKKTK